VRTLPAEPSVDGNVNAVLLAVFGGVSVNVPPSALVNVIAPDVAFWTSRIPFFSGNVAIYCDDVPVPTSVILPAPVPGKITSGVVTPTVPSIATVIVVYLY
jgi:hypothetical protein